MGKNSIFDKKPAFMIATSYRLMFFIALITAIIAETAMLIVICKLANFPEKSWARRILGGSLPSVASLPWLWFVMPLFVVMDPINILGAEIAIVFAEALLICFITNYNYSQSLLLSMAMNVASYLIGLLLFW